MGENKKTIMEITVDLGCEKCCKKIKKVLCAIPQIQNKVYNEKTNTVTITVLSCCPENVMKKICCKGGKTVKSIVIVVPEKPETNPTEQENPKGGQNPKQPGETKGKKKQKTPPVEPAPPIQVAIVPGWPPPVVPPNICCRECCEGHNYGPCHYGRPVPCYCGWPVPCHHERRVPLYDGYGRLVIFDSWGGNSQGCIIM